jgi:hypothetical protein
VWSLVVEGAFGGGVAVLGLETPEETGARVGQGVDLVQGTHEFGDDRIVDGTSEAADVELASCISRAFSHSGTVPSLGSVLGVVVVLERHAVLFRQRGVFVLVVRVAARAIPEPEVEGPRA